MQHAASVIIEAAGAVLWRDGPGALEVAVVHRPKYDDWSLPKGKLLPDEHVLLGALREVTEETGHRAVPGRPLGEVRYDTAEGPKRVRYWAARAVAGSFEPTREVDRLRWLPLDQAGSLLDADRDREVLDAFAAAPVSTTATLVLRHASAGDRTAWTGPDRDRPLDQRGRRQAEALVGLLTSYAVTEVRSADVLRCHDTLAPFAATAGAAVSVDERLGAEGFRRDPRAGVDVLHALAAGGLASATCSQREVIPGLLARLCTRLGTPTEDTDVGQIPRGAAHVLHVAGGGRLVAREWLPAP